MLVRFDARCWRMLSVRWQTEPLSGLGSAKMGGRWNRVGQAALYLSCDHSTAIAEFHQNLVRPGTLVAYDIKSNAIANLTDPDFFWEYLDTSDAAETLYCEWRKIWRVENRVPPTWPLVDALRTAGAAGALVPSAQQRGGVNLVLWNWSDEAGRDAHVRFIDPDAELRRSD